MPSIRNLGSRARCHLKNNNHTSTATINILSPYPSTDKCTPKHLSSITVTSLELPPTSPRPSLESSTSTLVNSIQQPKHTPKSCLKSSTTSNSATPKKSISWSDNYHHIGPAANESELLTIYEVIRGDDEVGHTKQMREEWEQNKITHREVNREEARIACEGKCMGWKSRFLREEEFRREERVEEAAYEVYLRKSEERRKRYAGEVLETIVWQEEDDDEDSDDEEEDGDED